MGSLWDEGVSSGELAPPVTHAAAFADSPEFELVGLCESDPERRAAASRARGVPAFESARELLAQAKPEVVALATPTAVRAEVLAQLVESGCRVVICEKPLADDLSQARAVRELFARPGAPRLIVNYSRRWAHGFAEVRERLRPGALGPAQSLTGVYGKGLLNCASHHVDVAQWFLGAPVAARSLGYRVDEGACVDRSLDAEVRFAGGELLRLVASDHRRFTIFEMDLLAGSGRARFSDGGHRLEEWLVADDGVYAGYRVLGGGAARSSGLREALRSMIAEAARIARDPSIVPSCGIEDGFTALAAIEAIRESEARGGGWVEIEKSLGGSK